MILDANGMPVLQPLVDNASTATFNAAFAAIGNSLAPVGRVPVLADLASLTSISAATYEGRIVHIDEGGANFQAQDGVWVQITPARFTTTTARDTAYAKASAAYRVEGATAKTDDKTWMGKYTGGSWQADSSILPFADAPVATGVTIGGGAWITLALTAPVANDVTWASGTSSRLTVVTKGRYRVNAHVTVGATSFGQVRIRKNATTTYVEMIGAAFSSTASVETSVDLNLVATDYIEMQAVTNSGGNLFSGTLQLTYLGPST